MTARVFDNEELLTARLSLRRPTPADIGRIYAIHSDPRACAHNPGDLLATPADAERRYRRWDEHWQRHGFGYWALRARDVPAGEPVGFCGIKVMRLGRREVLNLFYRLDPSVWGDGFATEAATAVVGWATTCLSGRPVIARVRPGNAGSLRVAARSGLHRAEHLDGPGEDGPELLFASGWPAD